MLKHHTGKHDQVQASQRSRKPLILAHWASEACRPGARSVPRRERRESRDEAAFGSWKFDDFQLDAKPRWPAFAGTSPVEAASTRIQFNVLPSGFLHSLCQGTDLGTVLLIGGREKPRQQVAQGIDRGRYLPAEARFGSILARSTPTDRGVEGLVRLAQMAAVG